MKTFVRKSILFALIAIGLALSCKCTACYQGNYIPRR
jgi:hypothetical protein